MVDDIDRANEFYRRIMDLPVSALSDVFDTQHLYVVGSLGGEARELSLGAESKVLLRNMKPGEATWALCRGQPAETTGPIFLRNNQPPEPLLFTYDGLFIPPGSLEKAVSLFPGLEEPSPSKAMRDPLAAACEVLANVVHVSNVGEPWTGLVQLGLAGSLASVTRVVEAYNQRALPYERVFNPQ